MDRIPFDEWWRDFADGIVGMVPSQYDAIELLRGYIQGLSDGERRAFLDELVPIALRGHSVATSALVGLAEEAHLRRICDHVESIGDPESRDAEAHHAALLRILASDPKGRCIGPVRHFLLEREIGLYWNGVPWALWPHNPDLFVEACARYFATQPAEKWEGTAVIQAFTENRDMTPLAAVARRLRERAPVAWDALRKAVLDEARNAEEFARLRKLLA